MKKLIKLSFFFFTITLLTCITSCTNQEESGDDQSTISTAGLSLITSTRSSPSMPSLEDLVCFKINFPISFTLPDQSTVEVGSEQELLDFVDQWIEENGMGEPEPNLNYPLSVTTSEGIETINSDDDFIALIERCFSEFFKCFEDIGPDFLDECFTITFPIEVICSDGTRETVNNIDEDACIEDTNHSSSQIVYPIELILPDGSTEEVASEEEFQDIVAACVLDLISDCD